LLLERRREKSERKLKGEMKLEDEMKPEDEMKLEDERLSLKKGVDLRVPGLLLNGSVLAVSGTRKDTRNSQRMTKNGRENETLTINQIDEIGGQVKTDPREAEIAETGAGVGRGARATRVKTVTDPDDPLKMKEGNRGTKRSKKTETVGRRTKKVRLKRKKNLKLILLRTALRKVEMAHRMKRIKHSPRRSLQRLETLRGIKKEFRKLTEKLPRATNPMIPVWPNQKKRMRGGIKNLEVVHDHAKVTGLDHADLVTGRVTDHADRRATGRAETDLEIEGDDRGREIVVGPDQGNEKDRDIRAYRWNFKVKYLILNF